MNTKNKQRGQFTTQRHLYNRNMKTQIGSPLFEKHLPKNGGYNQLTYTSHVKKRQNINRQPQLKTGSANQFNSMKRQAVSSLTLLSPIWNKYKKQEWNKQKRHFAVKNPQLVQRIYRGHYKLQTPILNLSRYKKVVHDFQDRINNTQEMNLQRVKSHDALLYFHPRQQNQSKGKKYGYRLNMLKESVYLGIYNMSASMRRPYLARTRSSVQFG